VGREDQLRLVRYCLLGGAVFMIGIGIYLVSGGTSLGWLAVGFGILDLATIPFVMRAIGRSRRTEPPPATAAPAEEAQPETPDQDPSYNPYARED
jgi:hypothetical protein